MSLSFLGPLALIVIALLVNWFCINVGVASIIISKRTSKCFLERDNQIEIALLTHATDIDFWVKVVLWIELFLVLIIGHYVSNS